MNDAHSTERGAVSNPGSHLSEWTLEQVAEGGLAPDEERTASLHLEACALCAAEVAGYRALFTALSDLPRFAPSPGFADAVIARTRLTPEPGPVALWLRQFMPKSRRGWVLLGSAVVAPALPILVAALWLLTHPTLTAAGLWQWTALQGRTAAGRVGPVLLRWADDTGVAGMARGAYELAHGLPTGALAALITVLAVAIPLSVWAMVRLVRTPMEDVTYANQ
jgi:hypothetical protein